MIFYRAVDDDGMTHIVGTQADARAINKSFEQIDIPTDKAGLMAYANEMQGQIDRLNANEPLGVDDTDLQQEPAPLPIPDPPQETETVPAPTTTEGLIDLIRSLDGAPLMEVLHSSIARLGQLGGAGWSMFEMKGRHARTNEHLERGLGTLMLKAIQSLDPMSRFNGAERTAYNALKLGYEVEQVPPRVVEQLALEEQERAEALGHPNLGSNSNMEAQAETTA